MAGDPADRRERLQMLGAGIGRRQQQEDEIDRPAVDRLVVDRLGEPREQAVDPVQPLDLAVRDRDALAESGRAQLLALGEAGEDRGRVDAEPLRRRDWRAAAAATLVAARKRGLDRVEIEEIGKLHRSYSSRGATVRTRPLSGNGGQAGVRLDPADVPVLAAIDHVELAGAAVPEHQRVGVPEVHQHHRVGHARFGNVDPRLGDDRRIVALLASCAAGAREDRVAGILDKGLRRSRRPYGP